MPVLPELDPVTVAFAAVGLCLVALIIMLAVVIRQSRLLRRYRALLNRNPDVNVEEMLLQQQDALADLRAAQDALRRRMADLERSSLDHVQRVGIVRYNAFPDTGADLSFSIALLDGRDNGFVLTSLFGRNECRTYAKPIRGGESTYVLSDEEKQALARARENIPGNA
ncbi:MAG: DUF4446 family protein [Symbiobacterium sp.]|uniref:DUF4446 family protein n=1 Tax=Symbiobacterium sp. TaxID=1971213 RepID=UPI003464B430